MKKIFYKFAVMLTIVIAIENTSSVGSFGGSPSMAYAQTSTSSPILQEPQPRHIAIVQANLTNIIGQLKHDHEEYGGHKERALQLLYQAQQELKAAAENPSPAHN